MRIVIETPDEAGEILDTVSKFIHDNVMDGGFMSKEDFMSECSPETFWLIRQLWLIAVDDNEELDDWNNEDEGL